MTGEESTKFDQSVQGETLDVPFRRPLSSGLTGVALRVWHCLRARRCKTDIRFDCDFGHRLDFLTLSAL
jgi:hypothetical protein